jgi:arylamine N-acetyltransferase
MATSALSPNLTRAVLNFLGIKPGAPDVALLDHLIASYVRTVPWESAFRIAKRARTTNTSDCPRWPDEFWMEAMELGGGGTCFESNYAFFSLLLALGYNGYLTINNMNESIGCHTAIVVNVKNERWLVDVGLPVHIPIPIHKGISHRVGPFHTYSLTPAGDSRYTVSRDRHPSPYLFTLIDKPVFDKAYRAALTTDYGPKGLFLNRVIVNKILNERMWRFASNDKPAHLEVFEGPQRTDLPITGDIAIKVASHFGMDEDTVREALQVTDA